MSAVYLSTKLKSDVMIVPFFFRCGDYDVPDTMNVHGIYDKKASMVTFESRSEFQTFL